MFYLIVPSSLVAIFSSGVEGEARENCRGKVCLLVMSVAPSNAALHQSEASIYAVLHLRMLGSVVFFAEIAN